MIAGRPARGACAASILTHLAVLILALVGLRSAGPPRFSPAREQHGAIHLVWSSAPGPGGGGGGGGSLDPEPAPPLRLAGSDALSLSTRKPRTIERQEPLDNEPEVKRGVIVPARTLASATAWLPGAVGAGPAPATGSLGPGDRNGGGTGTGSGDGPGDGPGLGRGRDGGMGGDVYGPGNGVSMPVELRRGRPQYTADAVRARVQGSIFVECVVEPSGACSNIRVQRSFQPAFGLDQEAIKAAAQWRFRPGFRAGQPVPVLVTIEVTFTIR